MLIFKLSQMLTKFIIKQSNFHVLFFYNLVHSIKTYHYGKINTGKTLQSIVS